MNSVMMERWNEKVQSGDTVYFLGDFSFHMDSHRVAELLDNLHGDKHLIIGNHDKKPVLLSTRWKSIHQIYQTTIDKQMVIMCHYPIFSWNGKNHGSWHLFGHCHGKVHYNQCSMDVGVDTNDFYPYSWDDICMKIKSFLPI